MDRELLQDSDAVNESFWDGLGVEFEAKYIFDFKSAPRGGVRAGRGDTGGPGTGGHGEPRDGVPITSLPSVPGRLKFGGEIGGIGYGVLSLQGSGPGTKKHLQKHHYQTPPLSPAKSQSPGGGL